MYCKHPEESCCNMTCYHGKVYCDNQEGFCHLHDPLPPYTNADKIRDMSDEELAKWLYDFFWGRKKDVRLLALKDWLKQLVKDN